MSNLKLSNEENYEHLCNVRLTKEKYPIAFENKVQELMEECDITRTEAEKLVSDMEIELEIYYEKGQGLFAIESEVCACCGVTLVSPYTGVVIESEES